MSALGNDLVAALARHASAVGDVHAQPARVMVQRGPWDQYVRGYMSFDLANGPTSTYGRENCATALGGFGAASGGSMLQQANAILSSTMPPQVKTMIDASPLTLMQKMKLKKEPLSVFIVLADKAQGLVIEYIERVGLGAMPKPVAKWGASRSSNAKKPYNIMVGGVSVKIDPKKSDNPLRLAMQFLAVSNRNIIKAHQVIAAMIYEAGIQAPLNVVNAVIAAEMKKTGDAVSKTMDAATKAAQDAAKAVQQATQNLFTMPKLFGELGGAVADDVAGAAAGATTLQQVAQTTAEVAGLVEVAIGTADLLMKPLAALDAGKPASAPTQADLNAASAASVEAEQAANANLPADIKNAGKIFGVSKNVVFIGTGVTLVGGLAAWWLLKKKKRG